MTKRTQSTLIIFGIGSVLLLGYTNCTQKFAVGNSDLSVGSSNSSAVPLNLADTLAGLESMRTQPCDYNLAVQFATGYYSFTRNNCVSCHVQGGQGKGRFADINVQDAFSDFKLVGYNQVSANATNPQHKPPYTGTQNSNEINRLRPEWLKALGEYAVCTNVSLDSLIKKTPAELAVIETSSAAIPAVTLNAGSGKIAWNLDSDFHVNTGFTPAPTLLSGTSGTFSIDVNKYSSAGETYYVFSNPQVVSSHKNVHVKSMQLKINGILITYATTYKYLDKSVYADTLATDPLSVLSPGGMVVPRVLTAQDRVSITFEVLEEDVNLPPPTAPPIVEFMESAVTVAPDHTNIIDPTCQNADKSTCPMVSSGLHTDVEYKLRLVDSDGVPTFARYGAVVSISADSSNLCGATNSATAQDIRSASCTSANSIYSVVAATIANRIPLKNISPVSRKDLMYNFLPARNIKTSGNNRFDWDFQFLSSAVHFGPTEGTMSIVVRYSGDIRFENMNRLLTLTIDANPYGAQVSASKNTVRTLIEKVSNPEPAIGEITYSGMMRGRPFGVDCIRCHKSVDQIGPYDIADYEFLIKPRAAGNGDPIVTPGNPTKSEMYNRVLPVQAGSTKLAMPADGGLDTDGINAIESWILMGAKNN